MTKQEDSPGDGADATESIGPADAQLPHGRSPAGPASAAGGSTAPRWRPRVTGRTSRGYSRLTAWLALLLVALMVAAGLAIAGQQHYQSCVNTARTNANGGTTKLARLIRNRQLKTCSHSPF